MSLLIAPDATDAFVEVGVAEWSGVTDIVHMSPADKRLDEAGRTLEIFLDMLDATFAANHTYLLADKYEGALSAPDRSMKGQIAGARRTPARASLARGHEDRPHHAGSSQTRAVTA